MPPLFYYRTFDTTQYSVLRAKATIERRPNMLKPAFPWTHSQAVVLAIITAFSSLLSIIGCVYILRRFQSSRLRDAAGNDSMVAILSIANIVSCVFFGLGPLPAFVHDDFCRVQGAMIQLSCLVSVIWTCCMGYNLFAWVVLKKSTESLKSYRKFYAFISLALPLITVFVVLADDGFGPTG
jgi:hypothetical protein